MRIVGIRPGLQANLKSPPTANAGWTMNDSVKHVADGASIGTLLATFAGWLPEMAAFVSLVWGLIRVYETDTVQKLLGKKK